MTKQTQTKQTTRVYLRRSWSRYASHEREDYQIHGWHRLICCEDFSEPHQICYHDILDVERGAKVSVIKVGSDKVRLEERWLVTDAGLKLDD
jgi:hypothetical protein